MNASLGVDASLQVIHAVFSPNVAVRSRIEGFKMPYIAKAVNVMIASPGDVAAERNIVRSAVHEWNAIHARDRNIVLTPVGWDTHAYPAIGSRPQAIINKQLLEDADLLIAIFWTRLGTPTGEAASGTVEEIEHHVRQEKPAMIYFSNAPARLDSVDRKQYEALKKFKESLQTRGLTETYNSLDEFRQKVTRQLAQKILAAYCEDETGSPEVDFQPVPNLSDAGRTLLTDIAADRSGSLLVVATFGGLIVQSNGKQLLNGGDPRKEASFRSNLKELLDLNLVEPRDASNEVFAITDFGYSTADRFGVDTAVR